MKEPVIAMVALLMSGAALAQTPASPAPADTLFRNVRVYDGKGDHLSAPTSVLVRGNTIAAIGANAAATPDTMIVEGKGQYLYDEKGRRYLDGFGGIVSVRIKGGFEGAKRFCERLQLFTLAESLGGVESLAGANQGSNLSGRAPQPRPPAPPRGDRVRAPLGSR